jgi:hypothetical protein
MHSLLLYLLSGGLLTLVIFYLLWQNHGWVLDGGDVDEFAKDY